MRKIMIILVMAFSLLLVSCNKSTPDLHKAVANMQSITAMESETEISIHMETFDLSAEDQAEMAEVMDMVNAFVFKYGHKFTTDTAAKISHSETAFNLDIGGIAFNTKLFNEVDLANDKIKLVVETPAMLKEMLPFINLEKKYVIVDINEVVDQDEDEEADLDKLIKHQQEAHAKIIKISEDIQDRLKPDFEIVEHKAEEERNGEKYEVYTLRLDDPTFKELLRVYVDTILSDEELKKELDIEDKDFKADFDEFMDTLDKVQILGPEGVNVEYLINSDGYVAEVNGLIDLLFDLDNIRENLDETIESSGKINLKINFKTVNRNINGDVVVDFPELTPENSSTMEELLDFGGMFGENDFNIDEGFDFEQDLDAYLEAINYVYELYFDGQIDDETLDELLEMIETLETEEQFDEFMDFIAKNYE